MLTYLGSMALSVAVPLLGLMNLTLLPFIDELQAKFAAMIKLSLAATLTLPAVTAEAMIAAAGKLAFAPPQAGLSAKLAAAAAVQLQLRLSALLELSKWNATAGVHVWTYEGPIGGMASALQAAPAQAGMPPGTPVYTVVLLGGAGATKVALKTVFRAS